MPARNTVLVAVTFILVFTACGEPFTEPPDNTTDGMTSVYLTDAPFPYRRVARVDLYMVSIAASLSSDTGIFGDTTGTDFTTIAEPNRRFNLLVLQNGTTAALGEAALPAGRYQAVRMVLDTDSSSITLKDKRVLTGTSDPGIAWQSSAGRPVLNALVHDPMDVGDSGATIVIDFDVGQSFLPVQVVDTLSTDEGFIFSPWMRAVNLEQTGALTGRVVWDSAGSPAIVDATLSVAMGRADWPENTWSIMATGRTDAGGQFTMAFLSPNTVFAPRTYFLSVEAPSGESLLVRDVLVEAGSARDLGTLTVPSP